MTDWLKTPSNIESYQGFVYLITNKNTGKYYVGKKFFWSKRTRKPLKGRNNKRHYVVESDWKTYYGSSKSLQEDIDLLGENAFTREILILCDNKFDCAYQELLEQLKRDVLFDPNSYNGIINVRLAKQKPRNG